MWSTRSASGQTAHGVSGPHYISEAVDWNTVRRLLQKDDGEPVGEY